MARMTRGVCCVLIGLCTPAFAQTVAPVKVTLVQIQSISKTIQGYGIIQPDLGKDIAVSAVEPLRIDEILVKPGDAVAKGRLLVRLQRDAALDMEMKKAEINLEQARLNLTRYDNLFKNGVVPKVKLEEAQTTFRLAQADSELQAHSLAYAVNNSEIRAPISGFVGSISGVTGQIADPSQTILRIVNLTKMVARIGVEAEDMGNIREGQTAMITVPNLPDHPAFSGVVAKLNRQIDPDSQLLLTWIEVANPDDILQPGMFAEARLIVQTERRARVVPRSAVLKDEAGPCVFIVTGSVAHKVAVKTGIITDAVVQILDGVQEGQQVIYEGNYELEDGMPVDIRQGS